MAYMVMAYEAVADTGTAYIVMAYDALLAFALLVRVLLGSAGPQRLAAPFVWVITV